MSSTGKTLPSISVQIKIIILTEQIIGENLSANDQDLIKFILKKLQTINIHAQSFKHQTSQSRKQYAKSFGKWEIY